MNEVGNIQNLIYEIRGVKIMLDSDLAMLYGVETKALNRAVKRNIERFPTHFMFQLTKEEWQYLRCQNGTFKKDIRKYLPYVLENKELARRFNELEKYFVNYCNDNEKDKQEIYKAIDLLMDRTKPAKIGFIKTED